VVSYLVNISRNAVIPSMDKKKEILIILFLVNCLLAFLNYFLRNYVQPVAIVVPHHNVVQKKRLEFMKKIAQRRPRTKAIILLSPDHFSPNQYRISYSDKTWELSNGNLEFDSNLGSKIIDGLAEKNGLVANDHGVYNLLPDIKRVWPEAKIVPLLIGQQLKFDKLDGLISKINNYCGPDCLLIASVDFSHYLPMTLADIHDIESLEALDKLEIKSKKSIEVDSPQSLYALLKYSLLKQAKCFHFYYHSNSGRIEGNRDVESTGHFFGWYQKDFITTPKKSILTFLVGRDLDNERDKKSLGERFFYGVDFFDGQLKKSFKPSLKVTIEPSDTSSKIEVVNRELKLLLGDDLVVAGYVFSNKTTLIFLPLKRQGAENYLMRGGEKTKYLRDLLQTIAPQNFFVDIDINEGILVI